MVFNLYRPRFLGRSQGCNDAAISAVQQASFRAWAAAFATRHKAPAISQYWPMER